MIFTDPVQLIGATASPYTQKMLALLRYRRIPYTVSWAEPEQVCEALGIAPPKPALLPTFITQTDDGLSAVCDSTPIIRSLEEFRGDRSVLPVDPALAFLDYLIEDFADEWCTKYMFHYRWHYAPDADKAGTLLPLLRNTALAEDDLSRAKAFFTERQIGRLFVVGSNDITAPVIDKSYRRFLEAMEQHLARQAFILGNRPAAGDFALHGQLSQLVGFDPTPRAITHEISPRTVAWVDRNYDLSGLEASEDDWLALEDQPSSLRELLSEIGRVYAPAQLANAQALLRGDKQWSCEIDGALWEQRTFPYQAKCLRWTKTLYDNLEAKDATRVDRILEGTGVEAMLKDHRSSV
ncbi:glutathione S-transferase family protein [Congregibacter litoralis]|uniref:Glutathione S-transferase n=1 Tax=Congregibacter litoralis KT71 TaxID=314285 RepID=A4ADL7_9GAMM|nr:glutathione S-transferase N-terminal domain-containing protein [Congregibacter litoralis]EAQ95906.1 Glutathione S-transferase [Congregibacter litoralis KT71]